MRTAPPPTNEEFRRAIQAGGLFRLPARPASLALVDKINALLEAEFSPVPLRKAHEAFTFRQLYEKLTPLRRRLADEAEFHEELRHLIGSLGFDARENAFDPLRLRCILHDGHTGPGSERAYALHRDTWYGNPQGQINWWIPLHDVSEDETFAFYDDYFTTPVDNSSKLFDYEEMVAKTGWQGTKSGQPYPHYPAAPENLTPRRKGFAARAGDIILFSAAQLHGTCKASNGLTRWSLDFRTVNLNDLETGTGAPNVDNGSQPLAAASYIRSPA